MSISLVLAFGISLLIQSWPTSTERVKKTNKSITRLKYSLTLELDRDRISTTSLKKLTHEVSEITKLK